MEEIIYFQNNNSAISCYSMDFSGISKQNAHGGRNVMPRCSVRRGRSWGLRQPYVTSHLLPVFILQSRLHESLKQRMWSVGSGLELGVSLGGYEERMLRKLAHLHDTSVRGQTGQTKTVFGEDGTIIVVNLITMTMSLGDILLSVELISTGILIQYTRVCTQS